MKRSVVYDITRLATRLVYQTPNGIDRIDHAFAGHFIQASKAENLALLMALRGPGIFASDPARDIIRGISRHWGEGESPAEDDAYKKIVAWIRGERALLPAAERVIHRRPKGFKGIVRWMGRHGLPLGRSPVTALPKNAIYLNVSQFPTWISSYFAWMKRRPDIKPVFFIHDLLPLEAPEYFREAEYKRHQKRLETLVRFGSAAIVTSHVVHRSLTEYLTSRGRSDLPVLVAPIPVSTTFSDHADSDQDLAGHDYFVICSTIEPRKNHLMLLHVWRELVRRDGAKAPKLVLVGARGWENENVIDLLERCAILAGHVLEVSGLSTPSLKRLLDGSRALLMPSFAEGYGLPVAEAVAAGVPVIASDLEVFREIGGERITTISPIDGEKWLETIRRFTAANSAERAHFMKGQPAPTWEDYFNKVEAFLDAL
jgi:glycosyltransferase involved in cell wall biosynthesis